MAIASDYYIVVQQLYISYFGRPADPVGLESYAQDLAEADAPTNIVELKDAYDTNPTIKTLVDQFDDSIESQVLYPRNVNGTFDSDAFVTAIYRYLLNREPDTPGKLYWMGEIDALRLSTSKAAVVIAAGAMTNGSLDGLLITIKTDVASEFTASLDTDAEIAAFSGEVAAETARDMLAQVDSSMTLAERSSLVESAVETIVEAAGIPVVDELTSGKDTITGTSKNDTFAGVIDGTDKGTTLNSFDTVKGGSGTDTLGLTVTGGSSTSTTSVNISNTALESIETVLIDNTGKNGGGYVFDAASWKDVTTLGLSSSSATGDTKYINVGALVEAQMKNGSADLEIVYQTGVVSGGADNQRLVVDNVTAGTFTAAGIETVTIVSTSANASTLKGLVATGASKLVIQSAADFTIQNTLGANIQTVDASLSTGTVSLDLSKATSNLTITGGKSSDITGGAGKDTFIFSATNTSQADLSGGEGDDTFVLNGNLTKPMTINGGAGTDTLVINRDDISALYSLFTATDTTALKAFQERITNIEKVFISNALGTYSNPANTLYVTRSLGSNIKYFVVSEETSNTGGGIISSLVDDSTVELIATDDKDSPGDSDFLGLYLDAPALSNNKMTLKLTNGDVSEDWGEVGTLSVENLTIVSNYTDASSKNILRLTANGTTKLTITGNAYLEFRPSLGDSPHDYATIDASGNTGGISIEIGGSNQAITGSQGNDTFMFDGNFNNLTSLNGGSGTDTISISAADVAALSDMSSKLTSIEKVIVNGALTSSLDMAKLDNINHIVLTQNVPSESRDINNLVNSSTIEFTGSGWAENALINLNLAPASDTGDNTLNLKLMNTGGEDWGTVKTTQVEYINIESNSTNGQANILSTNFTTGGGSVASYGMFITGNARLDLDDFFVNVLTIDASGNSGGVDVKGFTQSQTIIGSSANDNIDGGGGNDVITGGTGVDTLTGGTGADTFSFKDVDTDADFDSTNYAFDVITDFVKGTDKLDFTNAGTPTDIGSNFYSFSPQHSSSNITDLLIDIGSLFRSASSVDYCFGTVNGNGYLVYDRDGNGFTNVIQLTGVTSLDYSDII